MLRQAVENRATAAANSNQGAAAEAEAGAEDGGEVTESRRRPGEPFEGPDDDLEGSLKRMKM